MASNPNSKISSIQQIDPNHENDHKEPRLISSLVSTLCQWLVVVEDPD
jgi:hypothetical protein